MEKSSRSGIELCITPTETAPHLDKHPRKLTCCHLLNKQLSNHKINKFCPHFLKFHQVIKTRLIQEHEPIGVICLRYLIIQCCIGVF